MGLARRFAEQLARPQGLAGRLLGSAMDVANRRPTSLALDLLDAQPGERVLDAGCGTGAALAMLLDEVPVEACGVDPSAAMIASARRRLGARARLEQVAIEAMPFAAASFDAVLALNVLYFDGADVAMVARLRQVLRPGGRLVAYVTRRDSMENWPFTREGLHRLYDRDDLTDALVTGGFARERICVQEHAITPAVTGLLALAVK